MCTQDMNEEDLLRTKHTFDRFIQKCGYLFSIRGIHGRGKGEFPFHLVEVLPQQFPSLAQRLLHQRLTVQVQQVEGVHAHLHLDL